MPPREHVTVHPAPEHLRGRAACLIVRRIAGPPTEPLHAAVHANPHACLNLVATGRVHAGDAPLPRVFLAGPLSAPLATTAFGGLASCSLVFPPWLLEPLFSCSPATLADRLQEVRGGAPALLQRLAACIDDAEEVAGLWAAWDALTRSVHPPDLAFDTLLDHGVAAASAQIACSARHYRRRFHAAMGLAPAAWVRLARWEHALGGLAGGQAQALTDVALAAGYADQAHLTRETRAFAGAPPARLRHAVETAQGHWSLSPARVRSVQDARLR